MLDLFPSYGSGLGEGCRATPAEHGKAFRSRFRVTYRGLLRKLELESESGIYEYNGVGLIYEGHISCNFD